MCTDPELAPHSCDGAADERGIALVVTLMGMLLVAVLGAAVLLTTTAESRIAGNFRNRTEALYAADAALERALADLQVVPDWDLVLSGGIRSAFVDGSPGGIRTLPTGGEINLDQIVNIADCHRTRTCSDSEMDSITSERPWGPNNPRWRLFAYGRLDALAAAVSVTSPFYAVVLVGDDGGETDRDPLRDGASAENPGSGVLAVRAEVFGPLATHKIVEATVARIEPTDLVDIALDSWRSAQNRRAVTTAVGQIGRALRLRQVKVSPTPQE